MFFVGVCSTVPMINLNFLSSFLDLCETLSFSKTAKRLDTVQPVVSRQIKEMEQSLGYPLFVRSKKQVRLTDEGIAFKNNIAPLYAGLVDSLQVAHRERQNKKTVIRVGCTIEAGENLFYPLIKPILEKQDKYKFHISLLSSAEIFKKMNDGDLDFGIVSRDTAFRGHVSVDFYRERLVLIGPSQITKPLASLEKIKLVTYRDQDSFTLDFFDRNFPKTVGRKLSIDFVVNSHRLMIDYVKSNEAFAVIPLSSTKEVLNHEPIKIHMEDKRGMTLKLVYPAALKHDRQKFQFAELIQDLIKKNLF